MARITGNKFMDSIATRFEDQAFGVCEWWGKKLGIGTTRIRMYFVYLSFFTFGSPVIMYFVMAFILEHKEYFKLKRNRKDRIWDL
jgi:phage shock protein C